MTLPRGAIAQYTAEEILPLIGYNAVGGKIKLQTEQGLFTVRASNSRLECLKRNQTCVWCGKTGTVFLLERNGNSTPHLNLYHVDEDGRYTLMTRDHIIPQSLGGRVGKRNDTDNLATMCEPCNHTKGSLLPLQFVLKMTQWPLYSMFKLMEDEEQRHLDSIRNRHHDPPRYVHVRIDWKNLSRLGMVACGS